MLLRTSAWTNLTMRDADEMQDSGEYRCSTANAVGGAEINVTLVVKKYPMPPNATLIKAMYNSRHRNEVELEWQVDGVKQNGGWTGFPLGARIQTSGVTQLETDSNCYVQFRIKPINHRTIGHPSLAKTPVTERKF
ncbi:hypothetical protein CRENBAI_017708 [Crenichthys baileyi]|uniref:Ig-like domain-containing protein n=1 Tax=Crenichthys baileyi TaxID=28760 RepID=A0AAV9RBG5_9TELE